MNQGNNHPQGNNQERNQFFQGASHGQNPPPAYQAPAYQAPGYQAPVYQPLIPQPQVMTTNEFTNYIKANDAILKNMQTNMTSLSNSNLELKNMFGQFMKMNTASALGSGTLPGNTITNPKEDFNGITTRSGTAYQGPTIPTTTSSFPKVVKRETEVTKDTVPSTNNGSTKDVQPLVVQTETPILNSEPVVAPIIEPVVAPVNALKPNQKPSFHIYALILMPNFGPAIKTLLTNKDKMSELARTPLNEHCSAFLLKKLPEKLGDPCKFLIPCDFLGMDECLALADLGASINLMPLSVWNKLSFLELSSICMTLELADRSISRLVGVAKDVFVKVGMFYFPVDFVVVDFDSDPRVPLILGRSFLKTERALIDEVLGFSDVIASGNPTPYYDPIVSTSSPTLTPFGDSDFLLEEVDAFLAFEDDPTSPKVDHSYFDTEGDIFLLEAFLIDDPSLPPPNQGIKFVLKSHKRAIAWKLSDIKGINPEFYTHKILIEEDFKPVVQHQRRVNPKIHDVIKKKVEKLLDVGLIYPISDSPWVIPVHYVPKKGGFTVVENEENELIPTRLVTRWRVCIDYQKLNEATRKDHFPLPFMDQMLERLAGNEYYCFLDGFLGYFQISIDLKDQEKTTFTCPYGTFAYRRMPFGLCNAPGTFQRYVVLGQRQENHFRPVHYASKTMTEAESNYTTTEKEMLAVVYAFERFRSYLIMNKSIVYTNHSAVKYLFAKKIPRRDCSDGLSSFKSLNSKHRFHGVVPVFKREQYILVAVNYLSKWAKAKAFPTNDARVVCKFLKSLSARFGTPCAIISDRGTHFCNDQFAKVMLKYGVTHCLATAYHPQTSVQVEVSNHGLKRILERTVGENRAYWSDKLDDALWAFRTAFKTPIGCTPYKLVYRKACHLPIELEHKAYWALKHANFVLQTVGDHKKV
nr:reverse transcriptase domain-containing protein [Tanacetum cinerariifolium]